MATAGAKRFAKRVVDVPEHSVPVIGVKDYVCKAGNTNFKQSVS